MAEVFSYPRAGELLARSIFPLAVYNARRRPEHVGSCVCIKVDGHHFLVTAGHVVVQTHASHVFLGLDGKKLERVPALVRQATRTGPLTVDRLDLGLLPLPASKMAPFTQCVFLGPESWRSRDLGDDAEGPHYVVYGFSAARSQVRVDNEQKILRQTSFNLRTGVAGAADYARERLNPREHLLLDHDPTDVLVEGKLRTMPKMHGVSGGAVVHFPPRGEPLLAGIVIEHRKKKIIVATRIELAVESARAMIRDSEPAVFL